MLLVAYKAFKINMQDSLHSCAMLVLLQRVQRTMCLGCAQDGAAYWHFCPTAHTGSSSRTSEGPGDK